MFGTSAFAQSPFAALSGNFYDVSVSETEVLTTLENGDTKIVVNELIVLTDSIDAGIFLYGDCGELMTLTATETPLAVLNASYSDTITLTDYQFCRGWVKINNNQTVTWVPVNNTQN
jgi:hypothetical protein